MKCKHRHLHLSANELKFTNTSMSKGGRRIIIIAYYAPKVLNNACQEITIISRAN